MLKYCLKCRKNIESKNPEDKKTKYGRILSLSRCAACGSKKSKFIKEQEVSFIIVRYFFLSI